MQKDTKILITILLVTLGAIGAIAVFLKQMPGNTNTVNQSINETKPRQISEAESSQVGKATGSGQIDSIKIEGKGVVRGNFLNVSNSLISYKSANQTIASKINESEVVLACTNQDLTDVEELDFTKIVKIEILKATDIASKIPSGEPLVIFSDKDDQGEFVAHTIAISSEKCN
jgi:hypothetical protein